jgi:hypothetical protein
MRGRITTLVSVSYILFVFTFLILMYWYLFVYQWFKSYTGIRTLLYGYPEKVRTVYTVP